MRPLFTDGPEDARHYHTFARITWEFAQGPGWAGSRNKVKELREILRRGNSATEVWLLNLAAGHKLPIVVDEKGPERTSGWLGGECPYFDAIEAMDLFVDMEKTPNG